MIECYDCVVVGGGIVGLTTARALIDLIPSIRLAVLEKEGRLAAHQTGHNSGVIHSGIYYRPGSYKARLCIEGKRLMHEFCQTHSIRVVPCGKVIVATLEDELPRLDALRERAGANGVPVEAIDARQLRELEPHATGLRALYCPSTAIVDYTEVAAAMARELTAAGAAIKTGARVIAIRRGNKSLQLATSHLAVEARWMVNCAGLYSDEIARLAGARVDLQIVPFRGEYYMLRPEQDAEKGSFLT